MRPFSVSTASCDKLFLFCRLSSCGGPRRSRSVKVLLSRQYSLFLYQWLRLFIAEFEWRDKVLWSTKFNTSSRSWWENRQRVSAVYKQWRRQRHTEQSSLAWRPRSSCWQLRQLALDRRTTVRYCVRVNSTDFIGLEWFLWMHFSYPRIAPPSIQDVMSVGVR